MIVTRESFAKDLELLKSQSLLSVDTETTGLRIYHGDRLFSISFGFTHNNQVNALYMNFQPYPGLEPDKVLLPEHLEALKSLFSDESKVWFAHNAKYDMGMLANEGIAVAGTVHCTKAIALVEYNEHQSYPLDACLERIGLKKDDKAKKYIYEHKLLSKVKRPWTKTETEKLHFDRVPFPIIAPYAEDDATGTFTLGLSQLLSAERQDGSNRGGVRTLSSVIKNERELTQTVFRMEQTGILIDKQYCLRAASYEAGRVDKALKAFKSTTGRDYQASPKLFAEIFADEKALWQYTKPTPTHPGGSPSFKSDTLKNFLNPAAKLLLVLRDAKSKGDFYNGFIYHADSNGIVHPNFNQDGAGHGRFSSSDPNFQNLTSEDVQDCQDCHKAFEEIVEKCPDCGSTNLRSREYLVRKAIIPRPGFTFIMPDFDQMEYRFMLENACILIGQETELVRLIKSGLDVHEATAQMASRAGIPISRGEAKTTNFLTLYGGGNKKLALGLRCSLEKAGEIRSAIFNSAPEIPNYTRTVTNTAEQRGFIVNWLGRRCHFPNRTFAYRAPNYHIAGGCADIVKVAMNRVDKALSGMQSRMVLTIHDELAIEVHNSELQTVPKIVKEIMENAYVGRYIPLTTGMEYSAVSLGAKVKGMP